MLLDFQTSHQQVLAIVCSDATVLCDNSFKNSINYQYTYCVFFFIFFSLVRKRE